MRLSGPRAPLCQTLPASAAVTVRQSHTARTLGASPGLAARHAKLFVRRDSVEALMGSQSFRIGEPATSPVPA